MNTFTDDDRIQRILNGHKRKEIAEKYRVQFFSGNRVDLPPEIEAQWLQYIDAFERQFQNSEQITLREFIQAPMLRPLAHIPLDEIEAELEWVLKLLAEHDVYVDFPEHIDLCEAYRFVTEELLDEKMDNISVRGMQCHFIYEEIHSNYMENTDTESGLRGELCS